MVDCGQDSTIILGKPWIVQHQCQLNFAKGRILFSLAHKKINLPMGNNTRNLALQSHSSIAIKPKEPLHPKPVTFSKTQALPQLNPPTQPQVHKVPMKQSRHQPTAKVSQRWVPKALLSAQGYYEGKASIWLPKQGQTQVGKPLLQALKLLQKSLVPLSQKSACTNTNLAYKTITTKLRPPNQCQPLQTGLVLKKAQWLLQLLQAKLAQDQVVYYFATTCQQPSAKLAVHQPSLKPTIKDQTRRFPKLYTTLKWIPKLPT